jgi:hypothetical protein
MEKFLVSQRPVFGYLKATLVMLLFLPLAFASANVPPEEVTCTEPSPSVTYLNGGDASFSWSAVSGAIGYNVRYSVDGYTSEIRFVTGTTVDYTGLPAGTYDFHFQTVCTGGTSSWIITEDFIL